MKNCLLALLLVFTVSVFAQNTEKETVEYLKITQKKCLKRKGYQLILKEVLSDSRCPEGVSCIWEGEIQVRVSVFQNRKFLKDEIVTISMKNIEDNINLFSTYLLSNQKKIKSIGVVPYPKKDTKINPKDYYIKIGYLK